tara:strand:- start:852 stop:1610 length:759 start_codon:yes stop_codon:yes gene_type:complete
MKRILAILAIGISVLTLLAACGGESSGGEATDEAPGTTESKFDIGMLVSELAGQGVAVAEGDAVTQPFFSVPGQIIKVNRESLQVFTYDSSRAAQVAADLVDPAGFTVGTTSISWVEPPHFYLRDSLMIIYVGVNGSVIGLLETVLGPQFAGAESTGVEYNYKRLIDDLGNTGSTVDELSGSATPVGFSVVGRMVAVNVGMIQVYEFPDGLAADTEAGYVSPDGYNITAPLVEVLRSVVGPEFAGSGNASTN